MVLKIDNESVDRQTIDTITGLTDKTYFEEKFFRILHSKYNKDNTYGILILLEIKQLNIHISKLEFHMFLPYITERLLSSMEYMLGDISISMIGKNRFAILIGTLNISFEKVEKKVEILSKKLLKELYKPIYVQKDRYMFHIDIGISIFNSKDKNIQSIMEQTSYVLKRGKNNNTVVI